jgi:hypothetical protein
LKYVYSSRKAFRWSTRSIDRRKDTVVRTEAGLWVPLRARYLPSTVFAHERPWYAKGESLRVFDTEYLRYGEPVTYTPASLTKFGFRASGAVTLDGVRLYKSADEPNPPRFLFAPLDVTCVFQAYVNRRALTLDS